MGLSRPCRTDTKGVELPRAEAHIAGAGGGEGGEEEVGGSRQNVHRFAYFDYGLLPQCTHSFCPEDTFPWK